MRDIPITSNYNNRLDGVIGKVSFVDTPAGNFAYQMFILNPKDYTLQPQIESHAGTDIVVGYSLVSNFRNSGRTVDEYGKTN